MWAICFDMVVEDLERNYDKSCTMAYYKIRKSLLSDGFEWVQGSTYVSHSDDILRLFKALCHLKEMDWYKTSVRDIRGFRMESWSNFTSFLKEE